jgi:hypothetical protein
MTATTTTLRLSSSSSSAPSVDDYIQQLTNDISIALVQKNDCLKTLALVLKNLIDPSKGAAVSEGLKYRTLKLDNPKLKARLFCSHRVQALLQDIVGMVQKDSTLVLEDPPQPALVDTIAMQILPSIQTAQAKLLDDTNNANASTNGQQQQQHCKKPKLEALSEKQKARLLREEKLLAEKERDRLYRKQTRAQLAADKKVRLHDENWKPSVSAAADKTGTGLLTFRDRHGE